MDGHGSRQLTHASFFSGVGGIDLGLERAGWRTVSFSEIDPYASAVLAERWPGIPNLGDIVQLAHRRGSEERARAAGHDSGAGREGLEGGASGPDDWRDATLWSGGFPCQDLSVAGKRRGLAGSRSGLAFAFLDLVERWRPPAILIENVAGLLSSHRGRDLYALQRRMADLGYVGAYRVLDAQFFGVPQRRRRVFIVALDADRGFGAERAAEVLSVGARCDRHPEAGRKARASAAAGARVGTEVAGNITRRYGKGINSTVDDGAVVVGTLANLGHHGWTANRQAVHSGHVIRSSPDAGRMRAADGLAPRLDDRHEVAATLNSGGNDGGFRSEPGEHLVALRVGPATPRDGGPGNTVPLTIGTIRRHVRPGSNTDHALSGRYAAAADDSLLPLGLDSHRYRCCGNGVVSSVAEWVGLRLAAALA